MTHLVKDALEDFRRSVEITRDVRFQANIRLSNRQRASSYMVSLLSLYVIGLSLIPNIMTLEQYQNQILLACSIILSVFVIFMSLIDGSQNFYHQGELLHQCARKIAAINHRLKNIDVDKDPISAMQKLEGMQKEYQQALDECPTNHDNVDFFREIIRKPKLFPSEYPWKKKLIHKIYYKMRVLWMSSSWVFMPLAAVIAVTVVVYLYVLQGSRPLGVAALTSTVCSDILKNRPFFDLLRGQ